MWRLLGAITLHKVREQRRFHLRKKRGLNLEDWLGPNAIAEVNVADKEPSPEVVAEWAEQMEVVLGGLDDEQRRLVDLRLQGNTQEEIATAMEISERTVRRLTKTIQGRLNRMLENSSLH